MEKYFEVDTEYENFAYNPKTKLMVLYTKNNKDFQIFDMKKYENIDLKADEPISNIQIEKHSILIHQQTKCSVYGSRDLTLKRTIFMKGLIYKFSLKPNLIMYFTQKKMMILRNNHVIANDNILKFFYFPGLVCVVKQKLYNENESSSYQPLLGNLRVHLYQEDIGFLKTLKIHTNFSLLKDDDCYKFKSFSDICIDVRKKKLYTMIEDRIVGCDLNLYLDEISDFKPTSFKNIENEVILHSSSINKLKIMEKNLKKTVFECNAENYEYISEQNILVVIYNKKLQIYRRINIYNQNYVLIDRSFYYEEKEDEFDESVEKLKDFRRKGRKKRSNATKK